MTLSKIDLEDFLNHQYLCESLTIKEVKTLLEFTDLVTFKKGDIIADIGEVGEALYFGVVGEAALFYDDGRQEREVGRMKEGEVMGIMSFFDRKPRSIRMRAVSADTQLLKLSRAMYNRLRVEQPYIVVNLLEHVVISLDHLFRRISADYVNLEEFVFGKGKK